MAERRAGWTSRPEGLLPAFQAPFGVCRGRAGEMSPWGGAAQQASTAPPARSACRAAAPPAASRQSASAPSSRLLPVPCSQSCVYVREQRDFTPSRKTADGRGEKEPTTAKREGRRQQSERQAEIEQTKCEKPMTRNIHQWPQQACVGGRSSADHMNNPPTPSEPELREGAQIA